jgi:hypothetical protein
MSTQAGPGQVDWEYDASSKTYKLKVESITVLEVTRSGLVINGTANNVGTLDADALSSALQAVLWALISGDITIASGVAAIGAAKVTPAMLAKPRFRVIEETLTAASLVDGTAAEGTKTLTATIPAGAVILRTTVDNIVGFAGDVSAVILLGDGVDDDRYNTGTPSLFATAAAGVDLGAPSGTAFHSAAVAVVAKVTSAADITPVIAGAGSCRLKFWILEPA